ncbi:MAG: hypothetical protein HC794_00770 [Nitrospiraceae bacterium]|nr:hypothetical protein [Nitrospiraceae bacterium]
MIVEFSGWQGEVLSQWIEQAKEMHIKLKAISHTIEKVFVYGNSGDLKHHWPALHALSKSLGGTGGSGRTSGKKHGTKNLDLLCSPAEREYIMEELAKGLMFSDRLYDAWVYYYHE